MTGLMFFLDHHEGTAAWVQAVGAIVVIVATALIAGKNSHDQRERERIERDRFRESIAVLSSNCLDAIDTLLKSYPVGATSDPRGNFLRAYAPSDFDVPMDGLAAIPLHQVGDAALVADILRLRGIMGRIKKQLDDVATNPISVFAPESLSGQRTASFNAVASILRTIKGSAAEQELSGMAVRS